MPRTATRWLAPSVVGGIVLLVAGMGVAFALIRGILPPVQVARTRDAATTVEPKSTEKPSPTPVGSRSSKLHRSQRARPPRFSPVLGERRPIRRCGHIRRLAGNPKRIGLRPRRRIPAKNHNQNPKSRVL